MCFVIALALAATAASLADAQSCRSAAAQQCRDRIFQMIQQHSQDFTGGDVSVLCSTLRDNMACLLWQAANCQTHQEQQRSGEHILAAQNFLDRFCDFDGGWRNNRCYQYDEISRCENIFNQRRSMDACNAYNRFKDCVKEVLQRRCSRNDEQSFPSFLVERARELAWTCASVSGSNSYDSAGSRYINEHYGSNYDPNNPNLRYNNDNLYNQDRYHQDRYGIDRYNRPGYLPSQHSQDDELILHRAPDNSPNLGPHRPNYPTSSWPNYPHDSNSNNRDNYNTNNPNNPYNNLNEPHNRYNSDVDPYNRSNGTGSSPYDNRYGSGRYSSTNGFYNSHHENDHYNIKGQTTNDPYRRRNTNPFSQYNSTYGPYNSYGNNQSYLNPSSYNNSYTSSNYNNGLYNGRSSYSNDLHSPNYPNVRNDTYSPPRYGGGVRGGYGGPGSSQQDSINNNNNNNVGLTNNNDGTPFPPGPHRITTTSTTDSPHRSPFTDSYCLYKATDQIRDCESNHQRRQYNARRYHADERIKESCCATFDFKSCLRNALNNHCREYGYSTIESIIQQKVRDSDNDCRQFDAYRCTSGAALMGICSIVAILLNLVVVAIRSL
ncbi:probable serine/threonine-protein kinase clkA isoform X1 [Varroa destructor]|uniref:Uncharacterized protein n=2 Tax=Varroa destructor TaxID=109461 RepID=A0A7M7JU33_VARDE|nr:probable serine/threonine-protein kinase clkA isoform X1 [Varroa destructor]